MDLSKGSKQTLLFQLAKYGQLTDTTLANWLVSPLLKPDPVNPTLTRIKLTASRINTLYRGSKTFNYNRLDLESIGNSVKVIRFTVTEGDKVSAHFPDLLSQLGVLFDADDLEDLPLVKNGANYTLTLKAKSGSLAWVGQTTIQVGGPPHISLYINKANFTWNQL